MGSPTNPFDPAATARAGVPTAGGYPNVGAPAPGSPTPLSGSAAPLSIAKPPVGLLAAGAVIAVVGLVLAVVFWANPIALVGWALAGPVAIGVMALYVARDTALRAEPVYLRPDWLSMAYAAVAAVAVIGVVVSSVSIALWAGHL